MVVKMETTLAGEVSDSCCSLEMRRERYGDPAVREMVINVATAVALHGERFHEGLSVKLDGSRTCIRATFPLPWTSLCPAVNCASSSVLHGPHVSGTCRWQMTPSDRDGMSNRVAIRVAGRHCFVSGRANVFATRSLNPLKDSGAEADTEFRDAELHYASVTLRCGKTLKTSFVLATLRTPKTFAASRATFHSLMTTAGLCSLESTHQ